MCVKAGENWLRIGVDAIFVKDASGLLRPGTGGNAVSGAQAGHRADAVADPYPLQLRPCALQCFAGDPAWRRRRTHRDLDVGNGVSHTPTELFTRNCRRRGYEVDIDLAPIEEVAERLAYIAGKEGKPVGKPLEYDEFHFHHQCAGGMVSNLQYQLESIGLQDRMEEILEEAGRVRMDLGYPIVISPFAQYIVTMAILNVMGKDQGKSRYETVPDEVRRYVRGGYGEIAGDIDPTCMTRSPAAPSPSGSVPGELVPPALDRLRKERGPFASDDDLLLAAFYDNTQYRALKDAGAHQHRLSDHGDAAAHPGEGTEPAAIIKSFHFTESN
jgi:oxaloacetate decarboxylase (Na+ extruding) subunit alpha